MIEFDNILNEVGQMTRPQWVQLLLLILPCIMVASHMGAMVFLGAEMGHTCTMPLQYELVQKCGQNWTDEQTAKYIPLDEEGNLDSCTRYAINETDCTYWWPNMTFDTNQSSAAPSTAPPDVEKCTSWVYDTSIFQNTVFSEFNLVCQGSYQRHLSQAVFMLGVTIGCTMWGQFSDRFGRKLGIVGPLITGFIFAISTAFSQSFTIFTLLRFCIGFCLFPAFPCSFILGTESVKPKYRVWVGQSAQAFFAAGFCLLALLGYYIRDWRTLQLSITIPIAGVVLILWFLFESPRWLISSRKYALAEKIIKRIISSGKNLYSDDVKQLEKMVEWQKENQKLDRTSNSEEIKKLDSEEEKEEFKNKKKNYSVYDVLKLPNLRRKSFILFYAWMVASCMYYGLTLNAADLGGDPFINLFASGIVEVPALYMSIILLEKWGRRPTLGFSLFAGGVACLSMMLVPQELLWLNITLSMLGKFSSSASFGAVYIFTAEIYPTPVRNVGLGMCSSWARIGAILSPFIAMLEAVAKPMPYAVFGLLSIIGALLCLLLPEVLGIKLPETLEEGEAFGKDQVSPLTRCCCRKAPKRGHDINENEEELGMMFGIDEPKQTTV